jgi:hypothetical protein
VIPTRPARSLGLIVACVLLSACSGKASAPSPDAAITGFDPSSSARDASFHNIALAIDEDATAMRAAALDHLNDSNANVHYAAVYTLAQTATSHEGMAQLEQMLTSPDTNERMLAAGSLLSLGDKEAIPVLIAALSSNDQISYWDPPLQAYGFARAELMFYTSNDFGLVKATTLSTASAAQPAWQKWWTKDGASVHFDSTLNGYVG